MTAVLREEAMFSSVAGECRVVNHKIQLGNETKKVTLWLCCEEIDCRKLVLSLELAKLKLVNAGSHWSTESKGCK